MNSFFGLDFGTTNSALSINENGNVRLIDIDEFNLAGKTLRSILFFNENGNVFVGQSAVNEYLKDRANGRLMQSIKTSLPHKNFTHTDIYGKKYTLEDLIAVILKHIKQIGEKDAGYEINDVVLGRPAVFSANKEEDALAEERLKKAAQNAGFKNIRFQFEPIAAALSFEKSLKENEEKKVLVGDFGGGTSDFTIIKAYGENTKNKNADSRKKDVLGISGIYIGGDIFDSDLMWGKIAKYFGKDVRYKSVSGGILHLPSSITWTLRKWYLIPQLKNEEVFKILSQIKPNCDDKQAIQNLENLIRENFGLMLFESIEEAKHELSSYNTSQIIYNNKDLEIKETVKSQEFEEMISAEIKKIEDCINLFLSRVNLSENEIDLVFLTGGTSRVPCVKNIFINKFGAEKIKETDAFTSVAYGLGLSGYLF